MTDKPISIDWKGIAFFAFSVAAGIAGGIYLGPLISGNDTAVNVIVTAFSVLAGFLIAIMTIVGDPGVLGRRSWRAAEIRRSRTFRRLVRQQWLFLLYVITLALVLAASLVSKKWPELGLLLNKVFVGFSVTAFILSLRLPSALLRIQLERHDEMIESKRAPKQKSPDGEE